jgi:hypothetical protein
LNSTSGTAWGAGPATGAEERSAMRKSLQDRAPRDGRTSDKQ